MAIDQFLLLATLAFLLTQASLKGPLRFYDTTRLFYFDFGLLLN